MKNSQVSMSPYIWRGAGGGRGGVKQYFYTSVTFKFREGTSIDLKYSTFDAHLSVFLIKVQFYLVKLSTDF
jgi:hypothetical protein